MVHAHKRKRHSKAKAEKLPPEEECMVCYERFPVSLTFSCGHELCVSCLESIFKTCINNNCPKCRATLPRLYTDMLTMINIYPSLITPEISLKKLQHAFPLICSAANLKTVIKCMDMGVNVNKKGFNGKFPLTTCLKMDVVKYLVEKGENVNQATNGGATPLIVNSQEGNLPVVKYLFKKGACINEDSLFYSSQCGHLEVVKFLVQNGALNVNKWRSVTPLYQSSQNGYLSVVKYLVKIGANVNQSNLDGGSNPLYGSCVNGHLAIAKFLVENGADVNQPRYDGKYQEGPLYVSCEKNYLPIVKFLVQSGADVNKADMEGTTPLLMSSQGGYLSIVRYLVENGADVNKATPKGLTPLSVAIYRQHTEVAKFLIKNNANIGHTKLYFIKEARHIDTLDKICKEIDDE